MTQGFFKISFLLFVSSILLFLNSDNSRSCGWGGDWDDYYSIFNEKLFSQPSLEPFFLSEYMYHPYEDSSFFDGKKINLEEWKKYLGKDIEINDIEKVLYPTKKDDLVELKSAITTNNKLLVKEKWQKNSLVKLWIKNKNAKVLDYFIYTKEIEPLVKKYYWKVPERDTSLMLSLIDEGIKRYKQIDDNFLKLRYAFQAIRLSHYTNNFENAIKLYDELVEDLKVESLIKYWALSLKAGALKHLGKIAEADYFFAVVFHNCPERRFIASSSLNVSFNDSLLNASLKLCKNNDERTALLMLSEFRGYTSALDAMKQVYQLNPESPYLELILSREVERVEREVLPYRDYYWNNFKNYLKENKYIDEELNKSLTEFVKIKATEGKTLHPYVWYLAAGYLMTLNNENHNAQSFYYYAKENWPKTDSLNIKNIKLFEAVNTIIGLNSISRGDENSILEDFKWLKDYNEAAFLFARQKLARLYAEKFDIVKTHLLLGDNRFNYDLTSSPKEEPIDNLITFLEKPVKTEYEKFLASIYDYTTHDLYHIKATILISQHKFEEARKIFEGMKTNGYIGVDPFVIHLNDCHDCDYKSVRSGAMVVYNQKMFVDRMLELDSLVQVDENNAAEYYFQMANGYYNITFYGNGWHASSYNRDFDNWGYKTDYDWNFYDCSTAKKYYLKAMNLAEDNEFAAKCCFMAAKCEQNEFFNNLGANLIKIDHNDFWNNYYKEKLKYRTNFKILHDKYSGTEFYKEVIEECKYFNSFVKNQK